MLSPFDLAYYYTNPNIRFREHNIPTPWLNAIGEASSVMEIPKVQPPYTKENYVGTDKVLLGDEAINSKDVYTVIDRTSNIYDYLSNLDSRYIFLYAVIIIIAIFIALHLPISWKGIIGLIIGLIIAYVIARKNDFIEQSREKQLNSEYNSLKIKPKYKQKYTEYIHFYYSIREIGDYNLDAFKEMIENLDDFMILYDDIKISMKYCKENYDVALQKRNNALNHLHSIVISLEADENLIDKLNNSITYLHHLTNKYLNDIRNICSTQAQTQGYDASTRFIEKGPYAYNKFEQLNNPRAEFTYDIY